MKSAQFFYGTSADEPSHEDKGGDGLGCPANTEYILMNTKYEQKPVITLDIIDKSGPELYEKLGKEAKTQKLLLCVNEKKDL